MARPSRRRFWVAPALGLAASALVLPLLRSTLFQGFEQKTVDARMRLRGSAEAAPEVVICAIDAKSVDRLGQWPWSRSVLAELVSRLDASGARAIVFDAIFSEPARCGPEEDDDLAQAVAEAGDVVLGFYLTQEATSATPPESEEPVLPSPVEVAVLPPGGFPEIPAYAGIETNVPALGRASSAGGHFVIRPDSDGTVRHYPMVLAHAGQLYPSLALRGVQVFLGQPGISVRPYEGNLPLVRLGDLEIPTSEKGELWINFRGRFGRTFSYHSIVDVLEKTVPEAAFKDRLVFVGATETGIGDIRTSPFDTTVPGVEIHATVADNLLHRRFLKDGAPETILGMLAVLLLGPLCGAAAGIPRRPWVGASFAVSALLLYVAAAQGVLAIHARHLYLFTPILAGLLGYTTGAVWRTVFAEAKARQIRRTFQQYVSQSIVEEMLQDPDRVRLGGEKRDLTVLFSDIRGFTSLSEKLPPERIVSLLNEYLTPMTRVILERGGTLDKYMGDAIMAFFGAPIAQDDHPMRAVAAALEMRKALAALNAEWEKRGWPRVEAGIGLNTGPMAVGNMGSTMIFDYTVIGDHVNLGSRLEGLTKTYGVAIVASEHTEARTRGAFRFREIDRVRVKGKQAPVKIFELRGAVADAPDDSSFLEDFATGMGAYREGELERAERSFRSAQSRSPGDAPTLLYLARLEALSASPPREGWDGVTTLSEK